MSPALFDFRGTAVRVVQNGTEAWFVAADACDALELGNHRSSFALLDDDEKGVHTVDTLGGPQEVATVSESGLYSLILRSRKPQAKAFKKWITAEVLPSLRKTGAYSVASTFALPSSFAEALQLAADQAKQLEEKTAELALAAPKIDFHDAVTASADVVVMAVAAQTAKLPFGSVTLFKKLREAGVLISGGQRHNLPKQRYIEQGLFTVNEFKFEHSSGEPGVSFTTHVTQKGIAWLVGKFGKEAA